MDTTGTILRATSNQALNRGDPITIGVRPEKISISPTQPSGQNNIIFRGVVEDLAYYGNRSIYRVRSESGQIIQVSTQNYERSEQLAIEWDDEVFLSWQPSCSLVFTE